MAELSFVFLKNRTGRTQRIVYRGTHVEMKERAEEAFPPDIARAFIEQCRGDVVELPKELGMRAEYTRPETMFLANWTGNPDVTPTRPKQVYDKMLKVHKVVEEANPFHEPKAQYRTVGGSQSIILSQAGTDMTFNHPARNIEFPPYQYKELPKPIAEQILTQEATAPQWMSGVIREIPAPSNFQPDMSWDLEDMRAYLKYMDPDAKLGASQLQLEKQAMKSKDILEILIVKSKRELMKRLFFRLYDKAYRRPTKAEFDEFIGKAPATHLTEDSALALIKEAEAATRAVENGMNKSKEATV